MKCKSCGANYKTRELRCPYCHTENMVGKLWMVERSEAELQYEQRRKELGKKASPYVIDRIFTRLIVIAVAVFILLCCVTIFGIVIYYKAWDIKRDWNIDKIEKQMEEYYENGEYDRLYAYMSEYELIGEEYYEYSQAVLLSYSYNEYLGHKYAYLEMTEEEKWEDDYHLEYALKESVDAYNMDSVAYAEIDERNEELYETYQQEIMSFWKTVLQLTDEEIEKITDKDNYMTSEEKDALIQDIKERSLGDGE